MLRAAAAQDVLGQSKPEEAGFLLIALLIWLYASYAPVARAMDALPSYERICSLLPSVWMHAVLIASTLYAITYSPPYLLPTSTEVGCCLLYTSPSPRD